jgi:hypothetical protein
MPVHHIECESCGAVPAVSSEEDDFDWHMIQQNGLESRVVRSLYAHGVSMAESLEVKVNGGRVRVRGHLPDQHAKWLCLECCRHVAGVIKLIDQVEVGTSSVNGTLESLERFGKTWGKLRTKPVESRTPFLQTTDGADESCGSVPVRTSMDRAPSDFQPSAHL